MKQLALALTAFCIALLPFAPMAGIVPAAQASEQWCDDDPVVVIATPGGNLVPVYNTMGVLGTLHQPDIAVAKVTYTTQSINGGNATLVKMNITIPDDLLGSGFPTRAKISTGPMGTLTVLGTTTGTSGSAMSVQFTLNVR